jgi:oligoendopeptidase F
MPATAAPPKLKKLPKRSEVPVGDTWDLAKLFTSDADWEEAFARFKADVPKYAAFQGRLGESAGTLADCLRFDTDLERLGDRIGTYAHLKTAEDTADSKYQGMKQRFLHAASEAAREASFIRPEIMAIDDGRMRGFLADPALAEFRLKLERLLRYKPHTLSDKEEKLLAMQTEMAETAAQVFRQLNDADMKFGTIELAPGEAIDLTHASFMTCLHSPRREVRKQAFGQLYAQYQAHENTLAATLAGSIQRDAYYARARNYPSALEAALFDDNVPVAVYDNLIAAVRNRLPGLHRYYELRRKLMKLDEIHHYDTYVPILADLEKRHTWDQAVDVIIESLAPLGADYGRPLAEGLRGRWCDRYENQNKRSGGFSSGMYDSDPYILMNFQDQVLDHVFTLAHEAGHSMHTWFSCRNQPYQYANYTIFVAEVASTFNEQLLIRHLLARTSDKKERAYLVNREIDGIRGTIFRQTMFAEFEKTTHALAERGEPLTVESIKDVYYNLLAAYFGPKFALDDVLRLECFRIPHFYSAFYVYKYATGLSAAIALCERVVKGGKQELADYLGFLKGGCSKFPLDLLRDAGVDMATPQPVETALAHFEERVAELEALLA